MEAYGSALQNGHMTIDEVRELEDRNPLPDGLGKTSHIQSNMAALPLPTAAELAAMAKIDGTSSKPMNGGKNDAA
jgi:hypothetical protein